MKKEQTTTEKSELEIQIENVKSELKRLKDLEKEQNKKEKAPLKGEMKEWITKSGVEVKGLAVKYYYITKNEFDGKSYMRECSALDTNS